MSVLGKSIVTSEFKINYARPAIGERLCATSQGTVTLQSRMPEV